MLPAEIRVSALVALEVETGKATPASGHSGVDCADGQREPDVGPGPRSLGIISKVGDLRVATDGAGLLALGTRWAMPKNLFAPLADVRPQSRASDRGL